MFKVERFLYQGGVISPFERRGCSSSCAPLLVALRRLHVEPSWSNSEIPACIGDDESHRLGVRILEELCSCPSFSQLPQNTPRLNWRVGHRFLFDIWLLSLAPFDDGADSPSTPNEGISRFQLTNKDLKKSEDVGMHTKFPNAHDATSPF